MATEVDSPRDAYADQAEAILKWLVKIEPKITKESRKIMELGMIDELPEAELETAENLSDLYHVLWRKFDSYEEALRRFVYALKQLGRNRHGVQCVEALAEFGIEKPKIDPNRYSRSFQFHQCLAKICVKLDAPLAHKLITYHALLLNENYKNIPTLDCLFRKLIHQQIISSETQDVLIQGLVLISADSCLEYIKNYRYKNNLPEFEIDRATVIREGRQVLDTRARSGSGSSGSTSSRGTLPSPLTNRRDTSGHQRNVSDTGSSEENRPTENTPLLESGQNSVLTVARARQPSTIAAPTDEPPQPRPVPPTQGGRFGIKSKRFALVGLVTLLILLCALAVTLIGLTIQSSAENYKSTMLVHDKCTIEVADMNSFFTKEVTVTQDTVHKGDSAHPIDYYLVQLTNCKGLNSSKTTLQSNGTNMAEADYVLYLLPGSAISYTVCASAENVSITSPVRIELVLFDNLEQARDDDFNPNRDSFVGFHFFRVGDGVMECDNYTYSVGHASYYVTKFITPKHTGPISYAFESVIDKIYIDLENTDLSNNCTTSANGENCFFELHQSPVQNSCLIANISRTHEEQTNYVHTATELTSQLENPVYWLPVVVISAAVVAVLAVVGIFVLCKRSH